MTDQHRGWGLVPPAVLARGWELGTPPPPPAPRYVRHLPGYDRLSPRARKVLARVMRTAHCRAGGSHDDVPLADWVGYATPDHLAAVSRYDPDHVRNCGPATRGEVLDFLAANGITLSP